MPRLDRPAHLALALVLCPLASCSDDRAADAPGAAPAAPAPWLVEVTDDLGVTVRHVSGATGAMHMPEIMGSGTALFDADGDGDLDLYLVNGNTSLPALDGPPDVRNRLLRQEDDGTFSDVTGASGLGDPGYGMGVAIGDIDNDGDLDVYVTNFGADRLYRNRGDGTFEDVTAGAGIDVGGWSCSATFLDYDRDGLLDLFITRYVDWTTQWVCYDHAGRSDYCLPVQAPFHDILLHNEGDGRFRDVSTEAGIATTFSPGLGVACADFDGNGWIDVYVTNDAFPNNLWLNRGDGTFVDEAVFLGAAYNLHGQPEAGMGIVAADLDNDSDLDLFMTHTVVESNTLYRYEGPEAGFQDATGESGLASSSMIYTGFGLVAFDIELDGDLDLALVNGGVQRSEPRPDSAQPSPWDRYAEPNLLYLNDGRGVFTRADPQGGSFTSRVEVSRGLAAGDIDRDGDIDLVMQNTEAPLRVFRNDAPRAGAWLMVRAIDPALRRDAIGALVEVTADGRTQVRTVGGGMSYLSAGELAVHFGLGPARSIDAVAIRWNDGRRERFAVDGVDRLVELRRGEGEALP